MPSRSSNTQTLLRSFRGRSRQGEGQKPAREYGDLTLTRITQRPRTQAPGKLESELGEATYNCGCGFVFAAPVLTSVDCPHCGDSQAW